MLDSKKELAPLGGAFGSTALAQMGAGIQRQTSREVERVQGQAIVAEVHEQARGLIAHTMLQNVGALTSLEQHLIQVAPLGEARYKHIVDAYAMGAAAKLTRW